MNIVLPETYYRQLEAFVDYYRNYSDNELNGMLPSLLATSTNQDVDGNTVYTENGVRLDAIKIVLNERLTGVTWFLNIDDNNEMSNKKLILGFSPLVIGCIIVFIVLINEFF